MLTPQAARSTHSPKHQSWLRPSLQARIIGKHQARGFNLKIESGLLPEFQGSVLLPQEPQGRRQSASDRASQPPLSTLGQPLAGASRQQAGCSATCWENRASTRAHVHLCGTQVRHEEHGCQKKFRLRRLYDLRKSELPVPPACRLPFSCQIEKLLGFIIQFFDTLRIQFAPPLAGRDSG